MSSVVPLRRSQVSIEALGQEYLVYDETSGEALLLTRIAGAVLLQCDGATSLDLCAAALGAEPATVREVVDQLYSLGLVQEPTSISRRGLLQRSALVGGGVLVASVALPAALAAASTPSGGGGRGGGVTPGSKSFQYTGALQTFTVPTGVTQLVITATGGSGGLSTDAGGEAGGVGGMVQTTLTSHFGPGDTLDVYVGGAGQDSHQQAQRAGGINGSGSGSGGEGGVVGAYSSGGGAASEVLNGSTLLVVAAGGGGAADQAPGGNAGTTAAATGGSVTAGGSGGNAYDARQALQGGGGGGTATGGGSAGTSTAVHYQGGTQSDTGQPGLPGTGFTGSAGSGNGADSPYGGGGGGGYTGGGSGARSAGGGAGSSYGIASYSVTAGVADKNGSVTIAYS